MHNAGSVPASGGQQNHDSISEQLQRLRIAGANENIACWGTNATKQQMPARPSSMQKVDTAANSRDSATGAIAS
jgi:hypothetical protein